MPLNSRAFFIGFRGVVVERLEPIKLDVRYDVGTSPFSLTIACVFLSFLTQRLKGVFLSANPKTDF